MSAVRHRLPASFTLTVLRHAQTAANLDGTFCGIRDVPLTPLGAEMARRLSRNPFVDPDAALFCSPFRRTRHTAEALARALGIADIKEDHRLAETRFGAWEGKTKAEIASEADYRRWRQDPYNHRPPGGESGAETLDRLLGGLTEILRLSSRVIVVTHKSPARLLAAYFSQYPLERYRDMAGFHVSSATRIIRTARRHDVVEGPSVDHLPADWRKSPDQLTRQDPKDTKSNVPAD